ncbi:AmmeMemoRadiSam system protein B [bacterium]|jgi:MEMO1 family protein|nr:AmmeMemoRadiSam system protein B [bacterium]
MWPVLDSQFAKQGWYPQDPNEIRSLLSSWFPTDLATDSTAPKAIIVPHAGWSFSGATATKAFAQLPNHNWDRIIIMGPSHRVALPNQASLPAISAYRTPLGEVPVDISAIERCLKSPLFISHPTLHQSEHSIQVELPFLQYLQIEAPVLPIVLGHCDRKTITALSDIIRPLITPDTLIIVSSDFVHYGVSFGYVPFQDNIESGIRNIDMRAIDTICDHDTAGLYHLFKTAPPTICGEVAIKLMLDLIPDSSKGTLLDYRCSAHQTGDWSHSVSYTAMVMT